MRKKILKILTPAALALSLVFTNVAHAASFDNSEILEKYYKVRSAEIETNKHNGPMKSLQELKDFTDQDIKAMKESMAEEVKDIPMSDDKKDLYVDYLIREAKEKIKVNIKEKEEVNDQGLTPIKLSEMATWVANMELYLDKISSQVSENKIFMSDEQKTYDDTVEEFRKYRQNNTYTKQRQLDVMNKWDKKEVTKDSLKELREDIDKVHNGLIFPVESRRITSEFGWRIDPVDGVRSFHSGTDISAPAGSKIMAIEDGIIISTGYHVDAGNYIKIRHSNGMYSRYLHLSKISVSQGEKVVQGQTIGLVGSTGKSTGPHLHLEIRDRSDTPVNAMNFYR